MGSCPSIPFALVALLGASALGAGRAEETVYLDSIPGVENGSSTYDPTTRACGKGNQRVFTDLESAAQALDGADVLYIRAGTYSRESVGKYITVHGHRVNYWTGALALRASGSPQRPKRVSAYRGEAVIIQAKAGASGYNPDPGDTTFKHSSHYYPHPAVSIGGSHVVVAGLKTYGQVVISGHDIVLENCDLGGGGPHMNQGQVVALNSNRPGGVYSVVIRSNRIHHSCWGESVGNGAAVMCYNASFVLENNELFDNFGPDVGIKDTGEQRGREIIIRYNFFGPSTINPSTSSGICGHNQDRQVNRVTIHHNVFLRKPTGISFRMAARLGPMVAHHNTFVNCGFAKADGGDVGDWLNPEMVVHHNLYFHTEPGQRFYSLQTEPWDKLASDHNLFFSAKGDTAWWHKYRKRATTLAGWQQYSGRDTHSAWKDPGLVNPAGSRPEDFKRKGDPRTLQDVAGSKDGSVCGAYETGSEIIGPKPRKRR